MDKFDDIWKNRFNEGNPHPEEWNSPDDEVWQNIAQQVVPQKKERKRWLWWLGLGFMIISVLAVLTYKDITSKKMNTSALNVTERNENQMPFELQADELKTVETAIADKTKEEALSNNSSTTISKKVIATNVALPLDKNNKQITTNNFDNTKGINRSISEKKSKAVTFISPKFDPLAFENIKDFLSEPSNLKIQEGVLLKSKLLERVPVKTLGLLNTIPTEFSTLEEITYSLDLPRVDTPDLGIKDRKFDITFLTGATFWQHRISNAYTEDLSAFDFNYTNNLGWQAGVNVALTINQYWSVLAGVQYERIESTSGHNSELQYQTTEESLASANDYNVNLATPYGISGAEFRFNRSSDLGAENIDLLVDFHSLHKITNWSLPVAVQFAPLRNRRKIVPTVSLGVGVNYLANISNSIQSIDTHHDAIHYDQSGSSTFVKPDINSWHFDARIGAGLRYTFSTDLSVNINYNWRRGLNPVFAQNNYNTTIDRHQLSLGLVKKIR